MTTLTLHLPPSDAALIRQYATEKGLSVSKLFVIVYLNGSKMNLTLKPIEKVWKPTKPCPALTHWTKSNLKF